MNYEGFDWFEYQSGSIDQNAHQFRNDDRNKDVGAVACIRGKWHHIKYDPTDRMKDYYRDDWEPLKVKSLEEAKRVALVLWRMS